MTNKEKFIETYTQAFVDSYPNLPADKSKILIAKAIETAIKSIHMVLIDGPAFKLTAERLGIKCTYKAFDEFLKTK